MIATSYQLPATALHAQLPALVDAAIIVFESCDLRDLLDLRNLLDPLHLLEPLSTRTVCDCPRLSVIIVNMSNDLDADATNDEELEIEDERSVSQPACTNSE